LTLTLILTLLRNTQQADIQNHENEQDRGIGQGEAIHVKYERLKLGGDKA
jgi:hypothetical protein